MLRNLPDWFWLAFGFIGQALFSMRFLIQWIASERARSSVVPVVFWYFSLAGGATLFVYALWRLDPVFISGRDWGCSSTFATCNSSRRQGTATPGRPRRAHREDGRARALARAPAGCGGRGRSARATGAADRRNPLRGGGLGNDAGGRVPRPHAERRALQPQAATAVLDDAGRLGGVRRQRLVATGGSGALRRRHSVALLARLARTLWPQRPGIAALARWCWPAACSGPISSARSCST